EGYSRQLMRFRAPDRRAVVVACRPTEFLPCEGGTWRVPHLHIAPGKSQTARQQIAIESAQYSGACAVRLGQDILPGAATVPAEKSPRLVKPASQSPQVHVPSYRKRCHGVRLTLCARSWADKRSSNRNRQH